MLNLYLTIGTILIALGISGFLYAYVVYLRPWERTWLEVVAGVAGKDLAESALIGFTLWHFGLFWQLVVGLPDFVLFWQFGPGFPGWAMLFFPWLCSGVSGLSQVYWQEKKRQEGRKRAKWIVENNKKPNGGEEL